MDDRLPYDDRFYGEKVSDHALLITADGEVERLEKDQWPTSALWRRNGRMYRSTRSIAVSDGWSVQTFVFLETHEEW